jgi:hypothetical protein
MVARRGGADALAYPPFETCKNVVVQSCIIAVEVVPASGADYLSSAFYQSGTSAVVFILSVEALHKTGRNVRHRWHDGQRIGVGRQAEPATNSDLKIGRGSETE